MTSTLVKWSCILVLPLSAALASPKERAVEVSLNSTGTVATKATTTAKSGSTPTHTETATRHTKTKTAKRQAATVNARRLSMRDTAPAGPDDNGVYHSIHDWEPRTPAKVADSQAPTEEANHAQRAHWWSRPKNVASSQKAVEVKP